MEYFNPDLRHDISEYLFTMRTHAKLNDFPAE